LGVSRLDTATGVRRVLSPDLQPNSLARLDGRRALVGTFDGALVELDLETGATLRRIDGHGRAVSTISISPDGRRVASGDQGGTISVRDAADGQELLRLPGTERGAVLSLAWSPDGSALVAGHSRPWAAIWAVGPPWAPARSAGEDS